MLKLNPQNLSWVVRWMSDYIIILEHYETGYVLTFKSNGWKTAFLLKIVKPRVSIVFSCWSAKSWTFMLLPHASASCSLSRWDLTWSSRWRCLSCQLWCRCWYCNEVHGIPLILQMYIMKVMEIIVSESHKLSHEHKEIALDSIIQILHIPGLASELFLNFDCDLYCTNLFEDLTKLLSKVCFVIALNFNLCIQIVRFLKYFWAANDDHIWHAR